MSNLAHSVHSTIEALRLFHRRLLLAGLTFAWIFGLAAQEKFSLPHLTDQLLNGNDKERRTAAYHLNQLGEEAFPALNELIKALDDSEDQVWFLAVQTIATLGPGAEKAIPRLIDDLADNPSMGPRRRYKDQVRYRAAYALGRIGDGSLLALKEALRSNDRGSRLGAAMALQGLGAEAKAAIPELIQNLEDKSDEVRELTSEALGAIGSAAFPALIDVLKSDSPTIRRGAAQAIKLIQDHPDEITEALYRQLEGEKNTEVKTALIRAIGSSDPEETRYVPLLARLLLSPKTEIQHAAINGLLTASSPQERVVPTLKPLLDSQEAEARIRAAFVLGRLGPEAIDSVQKLISLAQTSTESEQEAYMKALTRLGQSAAKPLLLHIYRQSDSVFSKDDWSVRTLAGIGESVVPDLSSALASLSPNIKVAALESLTQLSRSGRSALEPSLALIQDTDPRVRSSALKTVQALGIAPSDLAPRLEAALKDPSKEVRLASVKAAAAAGRESRSLISPLISLLKESDPDILRHACDALGAIGQAAAAASANVSKLTSHPNPQVIVSALRCLGRLGLGDDSWVTLRETIAPFAEDDVSAIAAAATEAIGNLGPSDPSIYDIVKRNLNHQEPMVRTKAVVACQSLERDAQKLTELLAPYLADEELNVRKAVAEALGNLGKDARIAEEELFKLLDNPSDIEFTLTTLRSIEPSSIDRLTVAVDHDDASVRLFACSRLGRLGRSAQSALPSLKKRADSDSYDFVRREANRAIGRIKSARDR